LGASLPQYSDYEHERIPMPLGEWGKIIEIARKEATKHD
jgi:hypothetical protein